MIRFSLFRAPRISVLFIVLAVSGIALERAASRRFLGATLEARFTDIPQVTTALKATAGPLCAICRLADIKRGCCFAPLQLLHTSLVVSQLCYTTLTSPLRHLSASILSEYIVRVLRLDWGFLAVLPQRQYSGSRALPHPQPWWLNAPSFLQLAPASAHRTWSAHLSERNMPFSHHRPQPTEESWHDDSGPDCGDHTPETPGDPQPPLDSHTT